MPKGPFDFHKPSDEQAQSVEVIQGVFGAVGDFLLTLPASRERSLAITSLEQSCMWAVKGIAMQEG